MNKSVLILMSLLMILFLSCKQKEKIIRQEFKDKITEEELEKLIFTGNDDIKTIKFAKINFKININDDTYESGGNIAILKDSIIIVSLMPIIGYEIARIFCFKDKILILDRQNKSFSYNPYKAEIGKYYIMGNFNTIISILTGRAFIYEEEQNYEKLKKNMLKEEGYRKYYFEMQEENLIESKQEIMVRDDNLLTENNEIIDYRNKIKVNVNYKQFKSIEYFILPDEIDIHIDNANDKINLSIHIGSIIINDEVNANVIIPDKYKEVIMKY